MLLENRLLTIRRHIAIAIFGIVSLIACTHQNSYAQCTPPTSAITGSDSVCINTTSSSGLQSYTPTSNFNTFYGGYDLSYINDGNLTDGTIWGPGTPNPYELTMTFSSPILIDSVRVRSGQYNGNYNKPDTMKLYRGTSGGTILTTINPTYTMDTYTFSNNGLNTVYTWVITPPGAYSSIREIECYGKIFDYSVDNDPPNTYTWTITGGAQTSGGNTNIITVDWGSTGMAGEVKVVETCGASKDSSLLAVNIHTLPTSSITGSTSVVENSTGVPYSVAANTGYNYTWIITGGTQAGGGNSNSITVNWGASGTGEVSVVSNTGCGNADTVKLNVTITTNIDRKSVA